MSAKETDMFYRMLSKLLDYPDEGLLGVTWEIRERCRHVGGLAPSETQAILGFVDFLESTPLTELQIDYVATFDLTPEHALHLTHHVFGDDKNRGPALIDLAEFYRDCGLALPAPAEGEDGAVNAGNELPDFLPLMLEFTGHLSDSEASMFLAQWAKVLGQLAGNLEQANSPYAPLVRLIEQRGQLVRAAA
jgi:nitrate reductase delta subunit